MSLKAKALPAISGLLDTHQWSELDGIPELTVVPAFPDSQFRYACIGTFPQSAFVKLDLAALPQSIRNVRQLKQSFVSATASASAIGDICISGDSAYIVLASTEYLQNIPFSTQIVETWAPPAPADQSVSAASLRLDAVVSRIFKVGRAEAAIAITHRFVFVNFKQQLKPSRSVNAGDWIVFRGKGRVELTVATVNARNGRIILQFRFWPS
jgi:ribosomal 50S subunit-recycling heat shock protein